MFAIILGSYCLGYAIESLEHILTAAEVAVHIHKIIDRVRNVDISNNGFYLVLVHDKDVVSG